MISFLRGNLFWMLLSLVISIGLWIAVTFQENPQITGTISNVPYQVVSNPAGLFVLKQTNAVSLLVTAPQDVFPQLGPANFQVTADASHVTTGVQEIQLKITPKDPRVHVDPATQQTVLVRVEPLRTKQVPVQVNVRGAVPFGYVAGPPTAEPSDISISGPQSAVDQVQAAVIDVNLAAATQSINASYQPALQAANGSPVDATNLSISPEGVVVTVQVTQQLDTKTVPIQAVTVGVPRAGFRVDALNVSPSTVTLVGDPNALKQVQAVATQPIDVTDASSDRTVQAALALPSAVAPLQSQQEYSVTVQVSAIPGTETLLIAPTLANRDAKVAYQIVPGGVSVTVSGPAPDLARLQATDIPVVANVQGITSGTHQVDVIVGVPPNLKLVSAQPASVAVSATTAPQVIPAAVTPTPPPPSPTAASG